MVDRSHNRKWLGLCLPYLGSLLVLAGCGPKDYKQAADERVYRTIDQMWDPQFGTKANYRVSDVAPGPDDIQLPNAVPASGVLTLPYALALATAHSPEYQTQKDRLYKAALNLGLVEHRYETQLFGGGSFLYGNNYQNTPRRPLSKRLLADEPQDDHSGLSPDDNPKSEIVQTEGNLGFNRLLATGAQISTAVGIAWADLLAGRGDRGLNSIFSAVITQPLFVDRTVLLEGLTQADRDTLYQIRTFNRFRKTFAVAVATQYFRALELHDYVGSAQAYEEALVALHVQVGKLADAGLVQKLEVDQAQQDVLRARDMLIVARRKYGQSVDQLKLTLALPMAAEFQMDMGLLEAMKKHGLARPEFSVNEAIETALCRRLDVANHADAVLDAQRAVYVAADAMKTHVWVNGEAALDAQGNRKIWVGPQADLLLDRFPEQHRYREKLLALNERQRSYDHLADTVRLEVRDAHRKLLETAARYQVASDGLKTAEVRIQKASFLMRYGRTSSRRVLDSLHDLYDARDSATNALVEYAIATLNFYRDTETLQVRPDGMWQEGPSLPISPLTTAAR
jgi:outer membrane protein TolC